MSDIEKETPPTSPAGSDVKRQHQLQLHARGSLLSEEEEEFISDSNLSVVEGERESALFSSLSHDELSTPLLAGNDFIELEPSNSQENICERLVNSPKQPVWNLTKSSLSTIWAYNADEDQAANGLTSNDEEDSLNEEIEISTSIAAVFLRDYESSRPCSMSPNFDSITNIQLEMYNLRFSSSHQFLLCVAMVALFVASFFEGERKEGAFELTCQMLLTALAAFVFTMDIVIRSYYDDDNLFTANMQTLYTRKTRARRWKIPMLLMLLAVTLETAVKILFGKETIIIWSSFFKPIAFFYVSSKARDGELTYVYLSLMKQDNTPHTNQQCTMQLFTPWRE